MAIVHDTARVLAVRNCASLDYQKGNALEDPPTWDIGYSLVDNTAPETHIPTGGEPVDNSGDAWYPLDDFSGFWLNKVPKTKRFA